MTERNQNAGPVPVCALRRPRVSGKFIFAGEEKILVRGVTYGAFEPDVDGNEFHDLALVKKDFAQMAANGVNTVRIPHTTPPRALLDVAEEQGLLVMVGLSVEQEIGYFIDRKKADLRRMEKTLRSRVRECAGHPALLCYALGNEIPASIARWVGRQRVESILERMYRVVKDEDPQGLVTYVNYPTTEYLQLPFLDLICFNVYLESENRLEVYLAKLQNIAGDRPLIMSELGLDALRNGEAAQGQVLDWQIRTSLRSGCAGVFVFSWTDEWYRAGAQVDDWAFGLTGVERQPKPALAAVRKAYGVGPWCDLAVVPSFTVIVCSYNGSRTIAECCDNLSKLDYPDFEVIVVDDGSVDGTADIAGRFGFQVIRIDHQGLSSARNVGLAAARGEIVAYIDDDAYPDVDWLRFLAGKFSTTDCVAAGGPNVSPPDDGWFADCVAHSPGNPAHVLLTDTEAEQLPGCNLAIRRSALQAIGGFDPQFHTAGDDVDICWRLHEHGGTLAFCPGAVVWHHRRNTLSGYLRQQRAYGEAESLLEKKWQHSRGAGGPSGRVYASGTWGGLGLLRPRIYHGVWGHAPFQSIYERGAGPGLETQMIPIIYLATVPLLALSLLGSLWGPLWLGLPLAAAGILIVVGQAYSNAHRPSFAAALASGVPRWKWTASTTVLHLLQPIVRTWGRLQGLRRVQRPAVPLRGWRLPKPGTGWVWSEDWLAPEERIAAVETELRTFGVPLTRGGDYDGWDLELHAGIFGGARLSIAVEDHSGAAQMIRYRLTPTASPAVGTVIGLLCLIAVLAAADTAWLAGAILAGTAAGIGLLVLRACGRAMAWGLRSLKGIGP